MQYGGLYHQNKEHLVLDYPLEEVGEEGNLEVVERKLMNRMHPVHQTVDQKAITAYV